MGWVGRAWRGVRVGWLTRRRLPASPARELCRPLSLGLCPTPCTQCELTLPPAFHPSLDGVGWAHPARSKPNNNPNPNPEPAGRRHKAARRRAAQGESCGRLHATHATPPAVACMHAAWCSGQGHLHQGACNMLTTLTNDGDALGEACGRVGGRSTAASWTSTACNSISMHDGRPRVSLLHPCTAVPLCCWCPSCCCRTASWTLRCWGSPAGRAGRAGRLPRCTNTSTSWRWADSPSRFPPQKSRLASCGANFGGQHTPHPKPALPRASPLLQLWLLSGACHPCSHLLPVRHRACPGPRVGPLRAACCVLRADIKPFPTT